MELTVGSRLKHAWNAFLNRAPTANYQYGIGGGYDQKIDAVAAMMDAYVAYKLNRDMFE